MSASTDRAFERTLVAAMTEDVGLPPERLLAQILGETQGLRPLPAPVALLTAPPMMLPSRVVVGVRRSRILLVAAVLTLLGAALLAGALLRTPVSPPDAWMGWGGDPSRTAVAVSGPTGVPRVRWTFGAAGAIEATPVIIGDLVLVSSLDGTLHALDLRTGDERWSVPIGAGIGPPATDGTLLFVEDGGGSVHALQLADGSSAWTTVVLGAPTVDLAVAGGTIFLATRDGGVATLDSRDGSPGWQAALGGSAAPIAGIAVSGDRVLVTTNDQRLVGLRRDTGEEAWSVPIDAEPGMPVVAGGVVWAGVGEDVRTGILRAFRLADGAPAWQADDPLMAPAVAGDLAISAGAESRISGRDAATGVERWRAASGNVLRQVAIVGDVAFVLSMTERQVYGLDAATGARQWQLALDSRPGCCLAVAQGVLAVGTASGTLTVFESGPSVAAEGSPSGPIDPSPAVSLVPASDAPLPGLGAVPLEITRRFPAAELGIERPLGAAMSEWGDIYVSDTSHHVIRIAPDGSVERWGGAGSGQGEFDFGTFEGGTNARGAIATGPDGLVYVSDADNHRVQVFTADGGFVREFGELGPAPGQFTIPFDLGVDDDGNVYVTDDGAERTTKFAPDGTPLWIADETTDPRLQGHPHTASFDRAGRLVVTIDDTATILRLDPATGQVLETLPGGGCESEVDPWDRIWVLDCQALELRVLDPSGDELIVDRALRLTLIRLLEDGRGVALGSDGSVLDVTVTPP